MIAIDPSEPALMYYEVIERSAGDYIIVSAIAPQTKVEDDTLQTGFRVDDLVSGAGVALESETLLADCVTFPVTNRPQVDIIISMDGSGSMVEEKAALSTFVTKLTSFLNAANLDWRIGVTGVDCSGIKSDMGLPQDFRDLWPTGGGGFPVNTVCPGGVFGVGGGGGNGTLIRQSSAEPRFTTDVSQIQWRINNVSSDASEYTATMGIAAVARALPRQAGSDEKIRPDAAVVVMAVTDEEDQYFSSVVSFLPKENLSAAERMQLEMETTPFVDYLLRPEIGATLFGLYNVPNSSCSTSAQYASAVHDLVTRTGGTGGSICQGDITPSLQAITSATAGIASGLRLRGAPIVPTIEVKHAIIMLDTEVAMSRSRLDGFDFDGIVNRIAFFGPNSPQTNDRIVVPYFRWKNSVLSCVIETDCPSEQKYKCVNSECR